MELLMTMKNRTGAAAVGAAAAGAYPYYGGACGYYPHPPCY
jgi:hypothetical protein